MLPVLAWVVLGAVSAVHLLPCLPPVPLAVVVPVKLGILIAAALALWRLRGRLLLTCAVAASLAGAYTAATAAGQLSTRLAPAQHGTSVRVLAEVLGVGQQREDHCRVLVRTLEVNGRAQRLRLELSWYGEQTCAPLAPGSRWRLVLRVALPRALANAGVPSPERRWFRARLDGRAWVRPEFAWQQVAPSEGRAPIARLRRTLARRLRASVPAHLDGAYPLLAALTLGLGKPLPEPVYQTLRATGTGHLFAISGLHVGLLAGACLALCAVLGVFRAQPSPPRWPWCVALAAAATYAALAGFTVPTQRALVALSVVFAARALARELSAGRTLALALLAVLLIDPLAPLDVGFWLSFLAVTCLTLGGRAVRAARSLWRGLARAQLLLSFGLLPIALSTFDQVGVAAPLVNLLVVPVFSLVIVPVSLIAVLLAGLAPAWAALPASIAAQGLLWVLGALDWCAALAVSRSPFDAHVPLWMLLAAQASCVLLLASSLPRRTAVLLWCAPLLILVLWPARPAAVPSDGFRLTVLDVGQGMAVVVRTSRRVLLYDAGPAYYRGSSAGARVVVPYLRRHGVRTLDRIVVSHGDSDHDGGLAAVLQSYPDTPVLAGGQDTPWAACRGDRRWRWDGVLFEVLHPPSSNWRGNDGSCVLRISVGQGAQQRRVLLTGDIQARAERHLVASLAEQLRADVVVAPHHGSASSSTPPFVASTAARHVVFAAGYANRWGFPSEEVVARWQQAGATSHVTASDGAVTVLIRAGRDIEVRGARERMRRYWSVP